ncbi:VOC family protein [Micromonospora sp. CNB394]|uniref:VOC family protein n=1 Tax=Micromonospora sp. CNB394 TaxID=1169151 RepID=UPI0003A604D0
MAVHVYAVSLDAGDPRRLARFWSGVLSREVIDDPHEGVALGGDVHSDFRIRFLPSDAPKTVQNRIHFDLTSASPQAQRDTVSRALALGGRHIDIGQGPDDDQVVLADPEGNEFCVIGAGNNSSPAAARSALSTATVRGRPAASGARRWAGRWSGTRARRPRSSRRAEARRSPGAARR